VRHWARGTNQIAPPPAGFERLVLHKVEETYPTRPVHDADAKIPDILSGKARPRQVPASKPIWRYFLLPAENDSGKRLLILEWDEVEDRIEAKYYLGYNQLPDPNLSRVIDDAQARGLLPHLDSIPLERSEDRESLGRLRVKLKAIAGCR
jgi:hypothetical protein